MGLYERLQKEIHGETPSDIPPITKWVKEVEKTGRIAGWQIIALLLYDCERDEGRSDEQNKHFVSEWEKQMLHWGSVRYERTGRPITPIDPVSLLPVPCGKAGKNIEWLISLGEADDVLATVGIGSASEMVKRWCDWMREGDAQTPASTTPDNQQETDPADLPEELYIANIAFRAVFNGYGNPTATFKNRLIAYLKSTYPALLPSEVARIATVANLDKARGRPAKSKE